MRDDTWRLVLELQSWFRVALVVGLRVPYSLNRVVILNASQLMLHLDRKNKAHLCQRDVTILVDNVSNETSFLVPDFEQLIRFCCQLLDLLVQLRLLLKELPGISFRFLNHANLLLQLVQILPQHFLVVLN